MACAGYLVRDNTSVVYAEITNGLLICSPSAVRAPEDDADAATCSDATSGGNALPLLALKHMKRTESLVFPKLKHKYTELQPEEEDEIECDEDGSRSSVCSKKESTVVFRLSGHVVEVIDCDEDEDDDVNDGSPAPLLPFSFRIKTKKMTIHNDGSVTKTPVDTMLLAAIDQKTKDEWMTRLARWNRYGWRETTLIAATEAELEALEITVASWREVRPSEATTASFMDDLQSLYAAPTPLRSTRRRFYRQTGPSMAMNLSKTEGDAWFRMRVVNTHSI